MKLPERLAVIGDPIVHSLSPAMHTAALRAAGLNWTYEARHVRSESLVGWIDEVRNTPYRGFNVTIPHKTAVMEYLDSVEHTAYAIGAVNTVVNESERLTGHNTDAPGLLAALDLAGINSGGAKVVIFGAGGAASAAVYALAAHASRITIVNRTLDRAEELASRARTWKKCDPPTCVPYPAANPAIDPIPSVNVSGGPSEGPPTKRNAVPGNGSDAHPPSVVGMGSDAHPPFIEAPKCEEAESIASSGPITAVASTDPSLLTALAAADLIINATSLGMGAAAQLNPFPDGTRLCADVSAVDLVYGRCTPFMHEAQRHGCTVADGLEMLVQQGAVSFRLWTGAEPDVDVMRAACKKELERRAW